MYKKILVPYDGSPYSDRAMELALDMAEKNNSEILVCHVVSNVVPTLQGSLAGGMVVPDTTPEIETLKEKLKGSQQNIHYTVCGGDPAEEILKCIKHQGIDFVSMGSRGISGLTELLIGSVSTKVVQLSKVPVVVVK